MFKHKDRELVAVSGNDGRLYLLDCRVPWWGRPPDAAPRHGEVLGGGPGGGLATWEDAKGTRWIAASVEGGPTEGLKFTANGLAPAGSIVAFKLADADGRLTLAPAWRSPNLVSPLAPLVVNGMVVAVSSGEHRAGPATLRAAQRRQRSAPARLYVLDAVSGKPLWNSGLTITSIGARPDGGRRARSTW